MVEGLKFTFRISSIFFYIYMIYINGSLESITRLLLSQLKEKKKHQKLEKDYEERMDMIMEVHIRCVCLSVSFVLGCRASSSL